MFNGLTGSVNCRLQHKSGNISTSEPLHAFFMVRVHIPPPPSIRTYAIIHVSGSSSLVVDSARRTCVFITGYTPNIVIE